jgi:hypothetical protein
LSASARAAPGGEAAGEEDDVSAWREIAAEAPELAARAQALFDAHRHKTIATLRRDGSPRISGIEALFVDGDLWFGGMWLSVKALDLRRDPRFALHSASVDPSDPTEWPGDAKVAGRVEEITDPERVRAVVTAGGGEPPGRAHLFRADVTELVCTRVGDPPDHLLIEAWHEGRGASTRRRA